MVGLSEIEVVELARSIYAKNPSHSWCQVEPGKYCVIYANGHAQARLKRYINIDILFEKAINNYNVVAFNAEHSTEEVLAVYDQIISELKAKYALETTRELHDDIRTEVAIEV